MRKIRVLVVDDTALIRQIISDIVRQDPELELAGVAYNGLDAISKIKTLQPDVVTLDLEMPMMDGLVSLREIMAIKPMPVIVVSGHTRAGSQKTMEALSSGAFDFVTKPGAKRDETTEELRKILPAKIKAAAVARVDIMLKKHQQEVFSSTKQAATKYAPKETGIIVAIGSSTGGPRALEEVLRNLPDNLPATFLIAQHMPAGFTASLAERLNQISLLKVKEAAAGDLLLEGSAYIAPGGYHMIIKGQKIFLDDGPKVNHVRPSVDVMLNSLEKCPQRVMVVILTGMGRDGAAGAEKLKQYKKDTLIIAQDPCTAIVSGMPDAVINTGLCDMVVPLTNVASQIVCNLGEWNKGMG